MEERQKCFIVGDLMESYEDDILNPETEEMIKCHLQTCVNCQSNYKRMQIKRQEEAQLEQLQGSRFQRKLLGYQLLGFFMGVLLTIGIVVTGVLLLMLWTEILERLFQLL